MQPARPQTLKQSLVTFISAVTVFTATVSVTSAPQDLFTHVETLTLSDGTPASGRVSSAGHIAVVGGRGVAHVFEREPGGEHWVHRDTLIPSDGNSGFGQAVATDGQTIVVGATNFSPADAGAAYVFQREPGNHAWLEIARLTGDENPSAVGQSVAVSGPTVVVGAPFAETPLEPGDWEWYTCSSGILAGRRMGRGRAIGRAAGRSGNV